MVLWVLIKVLNQTNQYQRQRQIVFFLVLVMTCESLMLYFMLNNIRR